MTARVYIETSIISYLTGRPSRDVVVAGHQALTRRWWRGRRTYTLFGIPRLALTDQATELANELVHRGALPKKATVDGFHIAIAAAHQVDYLLTWNCKHLANATMRGTIEGVCRSEGLRPPIICTPEELPSGSSA